MGGGGRQPATRRGGCGGVLKHVLDAVINEQMGYQFSGRERGFCCIMRNEWPELA